MYELLDETLDYGYPQNCAIDVLQLYINLGKPPPPLRVSKTRAALAALPPALRQ